MTNKKNRRPRIFVGSSTEKLDAAYAAQENLEHSAEVTVWTQDIFELSKTTIEALVTALDVFDFAVFVLAPDDILRMRRKNSSAVRDNVLFELGLFIGRLGKGRCYLLVPRGTEAFRLPTDLLGITPATYDAKRQDENLNAALGPACSKIRRSVEKLGPIVRSLPTVRPNRRVTNGLSEEFLAEIQQNLSAQQQYIEKAMENFDRRLTSYVQAEESVETSEDPVPKVLSMSKEKLSSTARALLVAIASRHLTLKQYKGLAGSPVAKQALEELREIGFLVPVQSAHGASVYWYPPDLAPHLLKAIASIATDPEAGQKVLAALKSVQYMAIN